MNTKRCPIDDPHACLGTRCQIFGVCDHNRRLDADDRWPAIRARMVLYGESQQVAARAVNIHQRSGSDG